MDILFPKSTHLLPIRNLTNSNKTKVRHFCNLYWIKKKGKYCNFGTDFNNQIRDLVLRKYKSDYVNHKLFEERQELTLAWMLELPEQCERVEHQISYLSVSKQGPEDVNRVYNN